MAIPVSHDIQKSHWDPATIYGLVFGLTAILLAVPGAAIGYIKLREHRRRQRSQGISPIQLQDILGGF